MHSYKDVRKFDEIFDLEDIADTRFDYLTSESLVMYVVVDPWHGVLYVAKIPSMDRADIEYFENEYPGSDINFEALNSSDGTVDGYLSITLYTSEPTKEAALAEIESYGDQPFEKLKEVYSDRYSI